MIVRFYQVGTSSVGEREARGRRGDEIVDGLPAFPDINRVSSELMIVRSVSPQVYHIYDSTDSLYSRHPVSDYIKTK